MWHRSLDSCIEKIQTGSERIAAIRMCLQHYSIIVIQVYLPSANLNSETFKCVVDQLYDLCAIYSTNNNIVIMGDYVSSLCSIFNLTVVTDTDLCTSPQYTFYPYTGANPTRIDHILLDEALVQKMVSCSVISDAPLNVSRHLPSTVHLKNRSKR